MCSGKIVGWVVGVVAAAMLRTRLRVNAMSTENLHVFLNERRD